MSNIKRVEIAGDLPFNTYDHVDLNAMLGAMNAPVFGLRIEWPRSGQIRSGPVNKHGGTTTFYPFSIDGDEAIRVEWLDRFAELVRLAGGKLKGKAWDIENGDALVWERRV